MIHVFVQMTSHQGGETSRDQQLGTAERQYYSEMCDQLFRKYTTIKARTTEGQRGRVWKCFVPGRTAAVCKLCKVSVKHGPKESTTNLSAHLQQCHGKEFTEMVETEAIKQVNVVILKYLFTAIAAAAATKNRGDPKSRGSGK